MGEFRKRRRRQRDLPRKATWTQVVCQAQASSPPPAGGSCWCGHAVRVKDNGIGDTGDAVDAASDEIVETVCWSKRKRRSRSAPPKSRACRMGGMVKAGDRRVAWAGHAVVRRSGGFQTVEAEMGFRESEYERKAAFRRTSASIDADARSPGDERGRRYGHMLALGSEDQNLYPVLRGVRGARRFMATRDIGWWRHVGFERPGVGGPTRNMASSQIACINFLLPLAPAKGAISAMLRAIDRDVREVVTIDDPVARTSSSVEFEWIGLGHALEGELVKTRGAVSTSIDAFVVAETRRDRRAYLMEWKYTESYGGEDKGTGAEGDTRRRRYRRPYADSASFAGTVLLHAWFYEPFYQIVRQRLLADRMIARCELGVKEAKVVVVVPEGNEAYRGNVTSPVLAAAFPEAKSVEAVVRVALREPDRDFAIVDQGTLAEAVRAECGNAVRQWSRYQSRRYGW